MRSWHLARSQTTCGRCGASISKDAPVQLISQIGLTRVLRRCQACAEGTFDSGQISETRWARKIPGGMAHGTEAPKVYEWTSAGELARALERRR